jgi:hypothetical protein
MAPKGKMPPALLAHFKSKAEGADKESSATPEEKKEGDKEKRKEAVKKARIRMEESSRGGQRGKQEKTGQERTEKS